MTFAAWLRRQASREDALGDLARDARRDRRFPRRAGLRRVMRYLDQAGACERALDTCARAGREFGNVNEQGARPL
jgi:hypothetical protein